MGNVIDINYNIDVTNKYLVDGGNEMITLIIEHDNGKAGQKGFSDHQISEKAEAQKIINEYVSKGILIYSINFYQF